MIHILNRHPDRSAIILHLDQNILKHIPKHEYEKYIKHNKFKYLVSNDMSVGEFMCLIRNRMYLQPEHSIFMFVENLLPSITMRISELYSLYHDHDGLLHLYVKMENTFG